MKSLNWGLLGLGAIASDFAKALKEVNGTVYAAGSRSLDKAKAFAKEHHVEKAYGSYEELLQDENVDIVYIATPHSNHYEYMTKCLQHHKHVLCEKAITVNARQLKEISGLAKEKQLVVSEAMTIYHMPLYKQLRDIVKSGRIGPLKMVQVSFGTRKPYDVTNRFFNKELAGGALLDTGAYALSFARYFLTSQPNEILSTAKLTDTGVDEQSGIILKNADNEMAVISLTMRAKMPKRGVVAGENGFITVDDFTRPDKALITYANGKTEVIEEGETAKGLNYEVEDMQVAVLHQTGSQTISLSLDVMSIMDNVREQWGITYPFEYENIRLS
ncbi:MULTISPECIES: Gfo/Idh/MocA family protein [Bacillus]|uniref:Gfo/Idh/MocA family oxidoreductase n=1 Tax=Bacillus rugosus TaxID=2715209 RepID=A0ACD3ZYH8_9BACI|nr:MULTISPECIES: Gfo/Idh/MocA family oxidoreductase [Bacillus]MBY4602979.1 Gfo/Idh/MocA family oxidoreductase [Bacillus sp. SPARC3]UPV79054.1 Gfo/Idh/MocA family oxidoreductase [Bacillus rugosus]